MSSDEDPKAAAVKARVLTHMTKDHSDSLALYLVHYCKIPTSLAPTPPVDTLQLADITLDHLIITHPAGRSLVKISPPMKHLGESRERLVTMHKECLAALELADFKVDKFVLPNKAWQWITHLICLLCFVTFSIFSAESFLPGSGSLAYTIWSVGGNVPQLARGAAYVKDYVLVGMLAIHGAEAGHFANTKLRRYWVPNFSSTWWAWELSVFIGGVAAQWRFDDMVNGIKAEREKAEKH